MHFNVLIKVKTSLDDFYGVFLRNLHILFFNEPQVNRKPTNWATAMETDWLLTTGYWILNTGFWLQHVVADVHNYNIQRLLGNTGKNEIFSGTGLMQSAIMGIIYSAFVIL